MRKTTSHEHGNTASGFALTGNGVIAVQIRDNHGVPEVVKAVAAHFPDSCLEGSMVLDAPRVGAAFRSAAADLGVTLRSIVLAAPAAVDSMRGIRLPSVPDAERRTLVRGELEQLNALVQGADAFDFLWIPAPAEEGRRRADATAYYCTDAVVDGIRGALRQGGFRLEALEPPSLALMRGVLASQTKRAPAAVVSLSDNHTDLCVHDGTTVRQVRRIPAGTSDLIAPPSTEPVRDYSLYELNNELDLDPPPYGDSPETMPHVLTEVAETTDLRLGSSATFLVSEIQRTLAFFAREHPDAAQPELLIVVGAESPSRVLAKLLSSMLSIPVTADHPMLTAQAVVAGGGAEVVKAFLGAVGIATANLGRDQGVPRLNIAQQEASIARRRTAPNTLLAGVVAGGVCLGIALLLNFGFGYLQSMAAAETADVTRQIAAFNAERAPLIANGQIATSVQAARQKSQIPASSVLGRVAAAAQPGVTLTALRVSPEGRVALEGEAVDDLSMQRFAYIAGQGRAIRSPTFDMMHLDPTGIVTFRLVGAVPAQAPPSTQSH